MTEQEKKPVPRRLGVFVDGAPLPEAEALALWERFSTWMEDHRGDLAGFATQEGYASVHPGVDGDRPVLRASKSAVQRPYAPVSAGGDQPRAAPGGSQTRHEAGRRPDRQRGNTPKTSGKMPK